MSCNYKRLSKGKYAFSCVYWHYLLVVTEDWLFVFYINSQDIKAFYMRQNDDGKTVAAMDMLVPRVNLCQAHNF